MNLLLAIISSLIAGALLPLLIQLVIETWNHLFADLPNLAGGWRAKFILPSEPFEQEVEVKIKRYGRRIRGEGHVIGQSEDPFIYLGKIKRNTLVGTFERKKKSSLTGTGSFLLVISSDDKKMVGQCIWFSYATEDVWKSKYEWERK